MNFKLLLSNEKAAKEALAVKVEQLQKENEELKKKATISITDQPGPHSPVHSGTRSLTDALFRSTALSDQGTSPTSSAKTTTLRQFSPTAKNLSIIGRPVTSNKPG